MSGLDLKGRVYLLTGASRGIGALSARQLAARGAHVLAVARDEAALEELSRELEAEGRGALTAIKRDLCERDSLGEWAEELWERYGPFDGVIHNAGVDDFQPSETMDPVALTRQVDLNLTAPLLINRALLPLLLAEGRGTLIHLCSVAGYLPTPFGAVYSATKAGLWAYNEALSIEYAHSPLVFISVHPGFVHGSGMHERHKARAGRAPLALGGTTDQAVVELICHSLARAELARSGPVIVNRNPTRPLIVLTHAMPRLGRWLMARLARPYLARVAGVKPHSLADRR